MSRRDNIKISAAVSYHYVRETDTHTLTPRESVEVVPTGFKPAAKPYGQHVRSLHHGTRSLSRGSNPARVHVRHTVLPYSTHSPVNWGSVWIG